MTQTSASIQADFDRIALLSRPGEWNHNSHYHEFLLRQLPAGIDQALDIGCGVGEFSRALARRSHHVLGLDLSPQMLRVARQLSADYSNIEYVQADVTEWDFPAEQFDCVASIATLHHLPLESILVRMRGAIKQGGTLQVLDLFKAETITDYVFAVLAVPANVAMRLVKRVPLRNPPEVRAAWQEHGQYDTYPPLSQVRAICAHILPGAQVRRHFFWRYSIVWKKGYGQ